MLAPALGLRLITPPSFLKAISEGTEVSAADKQTIDNQISRHLIKIYVYNSQNVTPDVQAQLSEAQGSAHPGRHASPRRWRRRHDSYQAWQIRQLRGIEAALARATRQTRPRADENLSHGRDGQPGRRPGGAVRARGRAGRRPDDLVRREPRRSTPGEFVAVLGPNGVGKSTLVKAALGLVGLSAGSVTVLGLPAGQAGQADRLPAAAAQLRRRPAGARRRRRRPRQRRRTLGRADPLRRPGSCRRGGRRRAGARGHRTGRGDRVRRPADRPGLRRRAAAAADRPGAGQAARGCCCSTSRWTASTCRARPRSPR